MTLPVKLEYFALLREQRGLAAEAIETGAVTARDLYFDLAGKHGFTLAVERVKVAINNEFAAWDQPLVANDTIVFIPPVAGG
jgi:molybdopterin converting factor small subunit